jgi:hypothetical protein
VRFALACGTDLTTTVRENLVFVDIFLLLLVQRHQTERALVYRKRIVRYEFTAWSHLEYCEDSPNPYASFIR